jgi:hypothetical protein
MTGPEWRRKLAWRGWSSRRGSRERTTLATTVFGLGLAPPASAAAEELDAAASCQARETTVGHFMSHTERSARAVSRCFASSAIAEGHGEWFVGEFVCWGWDGSTARREWRGQRKGGCWGGTTCLTTVGSQPPRFDRPSGLARTPWLRWCPRRLVSPPRHHPSSSQPPPFHEPF